MPIKFRRLSKILTVQKEVMLYLHHVCSYKYRVGGLYNSLFIVQEEDGYDSGRIRQHRPVSTNFDLVNRVFACDPSAPVSKTDLSQHSIREPDPDDLRFMTVDSI